MLRPGWFNQNFSEGFLRDMVMAGKIALPVGEGREAFVDAEDIADMAVAALFDGRNAGRTYELSGPRLLGFAEVARILSGATGRTIHYVAVPQPEYRKSLSDQGYPESIADGYAEIENGKNAFVSHDIETVLGRSARDFADFAVEAAQAGAWA